MIGEKDYKRTGTMEEGRVKRRMRGWKEEGGRRREEGGGRREEGWLDGRSSTDRPLEEAHES